MSIRPTMINQDDFNSIITETKKNEDNEKKDFFEKENELLKAIHLDYIIPTS